jgi:hypothetical protein
MRTHSSRPFSKRARKTKEHPLMKTTTLPISRITFLLFTFMGLLGLISLTSLTSLPCRAQEKSDQASIKSSIGDDGTGTIVVEARGRLPKPPVFFTARCNATAKVSTERIDHVIELVVRLSKGMRRR